MEIRLDQYPAKLWFRATLLFLAFMILIFLCATNAVRLKDDYAPKQSQGVPVNELKELIEKEHATAVDEIKTSLEQMDTWYHYKFILTGGVIALFLGHFSLMGKQDSASPKLSERMLENVLASNRTGAMLTLICVVAFVIDMHIRSNINGIQHLGQWISNYVEPTYLQATANAAGQTVFIPWETFIRLPKGTSSTIYTISFSIQLHYMTMVGYILFLMVFQNVSLRSKRKSRQQIAVIGFVLVHLSLLAFIMVAHTVRDTFDVGCFPLIPLKVCSLSGSNGSTYYIIAWLFLITLNLPYLYPPLRSLRSGMRTTAPETIIPATTTGTD